MESEEQGPLRSRVSNPHAQNLRRNQRLGLFNIERNVVELYQIFVVCSAVFHLCFALSNVDVKLLCRSATHGPYCKKSAADGRSEVISIAKLSSLTYRYTGDRTKNCSLLHDLMQGPFLHCVQ